ncbi:GNAT family N-acetyltransferase [Aestuariimicrobium soli]|uniref:GNAT family N-acetyltransferase n=1 Tax=Aestuariimicrobium soli TaxID=2035834 RepID=UPI003EBBF5F5
MNDDLLLRPWTHADAPALLRLYRSTPDLDRQLPDLVDLAAARSWIDWTTLDSNALFALTERGVALGSVGLSGIDRHHGTGWFHYWVGQPGRGRGLMSRAAATVADWALAPANPGPGLGLHRLELGHRVNNPASGRVALAAGFVQEGIERAKLAYGSERFDVVAMARLVTDPHPAGIPIALQPPA